MSESCVLSPPRVPGSFLAGILALGLAACTAPSDQSVAPATATPTVTTAARTEDRASELGQRLASAGTAFRDGRLFDPPGDNALEGYAAVLAIDPDNVSAREALTDLFPLVLARAEVAASEGRRDDAARLLNALDAGFPGSTAINSLRQRIASTADARLASPTAATAAPAPVPAMSDTSPEVAPPAAPAPAPLSPATSAPEPAALAATGPEPNLPAGPGPDSTAATAVAAVIETATVPEAAADPAAPGPTAAPPATRPASETAPAPPRVVERFAPDYPAIARQRRIEGWVELEYVVDANGRVVDVRVLDSYPTRIFDAAAERALRRWRFEPASRAGAPAPAVGRTRIDFTLG